ncbi:SH3 domain-containing protein [Pseudanabaena sp. FACHB-2040]|nr:SH3 domain-containing protein [Pseudanabaena sp. FACHB-2040]
MVHPQISISCLSLTLLLSTSLVGCSRTAQSPDAAIATPVASTPTQTEVSAATLLQPDEGTPINPPRAAMLTGEEADAEVNLRSQPTTQADVLGVGTVGEQVQLLRLVVGEGGYTWYYVNSPAASAAGWVRGDFINLGNAASALPDTAAASPTTCGQEKQAAFFETKTFLVYICETADGLRYLSTNKQTRESLALTEVQESQGTYVAINGSYQYHVNDGTLALYQVDKGEYTQMAGEAVVKHERAK